MPEVGRGEHPLLRALTEVAEEHGAVRRSVEVDDDAGVVARRGACGLGQTTRQSRVAEAAPVAGDHLDRLRAAAHERTQDAIGSPAVERAVDDRVDAADHGCRSPGVVGVPVRHDEQVDPVDPEQREAALERGRLAARCR